jgi:hypothetical protein
MFSVSTSINKKIGMTYIIHAQNLIFDENIIENNTLACEKYQIIVSRA